VIVLRALVAFVRFWVDFIVGDDWTVALAVGLALAGTWALVTAGKPAWWLLPLYPWPAGQHYRYRHQPSPRPPPAGVYELASRSATLHSWPPLDLLKPALSSDKSLLQAENLEQALSGIEVGL
jgi:hypothetical protein